MKKVISLILSLTMLLTITAGLDLTAFASTYSGTCGDNVTWSLDTETGEFVVSGSGDMVDYAGTQSPPWYEEFKDYINTITILDGVTSIGNNAFSHCENLTSITIPNSVTRIGRSALNGSTNLKSITIPDSVTSIGSSAFWGCRSLTSITIPASVTEIGGVSSYSTGVVEIGDADTFEYCTSLTDIIVDSNNPNYSSENGVLYNKDKTDLIRYPAGKTNTYYEVADSIVNIYGNAFSYCENLTSVTIPNSVISIGDSTFYRCTNLANITIGNGVTTIGQLAFYNTEYYNDESNWEDDVLYIGNYLIEANTSISGDYTVKEGTLCIARSAFEDCSGLTGITIDDSLVSICEEAFEYCTSLTDISIGNGVINILESAFYDTGYYNDESNWENGVLYIGNYLIVAKGTVDENYTIRDNTRCIANDAFYCYLTNLKSITIPSSVIKIGNSAFYDSSNLSDVYYNSTISEWDSIIIEKLNDCLLNATIHCTDGVINGTGTDDSTDTSTGGSTSSGDTSSTGTTDSTGSGTSTTTDTATNSATAVTTAASTDTTTTTASSSSVSTPKKTKVKKATSSKKKQIKVTWKKVSGVTGYQVQYATNKKFTKNKKTVTVKGAKKTSKTIKKLKSKKTYYVRVRTYKTVNGKKVYSNWSTVKKVKTK